MDRAHRTRLRLAIDQLRAEHEGPAGLARRRDQRLRALVEHARAGSPFYERLYRHLPAAGVTLHDLPPVTKPELMADFDNWVTDRTLTLAGLGEFIADPGRVGTPYLGRYFVGTTSGTTGHPGIFVHDRRACAVYESFSFRIDRTWLSPRQWLQMARRRGRWAAVVGAGAHYAGAGWMEYQRRRSRWKHHHYRVVPAQHRLDVIVQELDTFDPAILTGYPSVLELLALEQQAGRLRIRPVVVELGGESVDDTARARITEGLGGALHDVYSASEFMIMAFDCAEGRLHVNSDWAILEPVDEHYHPTPPGEPSHTVLLTNLANAVQPLIRYDLGDSLLAETAPCRCGSALPAVSVQGRRDDVLRFTDTHGRSVALPPLVIGSVADETPGVRRSQLVQTSPTTLRIRLDVEAEASPDPVWEGVRSKIATYLAAHDLRDVEIVRGPEQPQQTTGSGKYRQVIADQRA
ncbi:phenylacetate--CoA ligase family protein [Rhodococcus aetherivorans]|uniref:phenylacetate--CoA ligase family protein n=1 Tax=Rhodococcus aetherivorans TaxID=191292 RepID=UPI00241D1CEC|nr:phenylacetate--CoA ligase family protein [Rhodococcus aetherivorans]WFS14990.1 phenylacetate--CoA ligase family protein [Rhodococcus aetherivorans]